MRLFIGVPVPESVKTKILELQRDLKEKAPGLNYAPSDNLHLTLKFLGELPKTRVSMIKEALTDVASGLEPFMTSLKSLGVFPSKNFISVVWAGVDNGRDEFIKLMQLAEEKLGSLRPETNEPHPHLTFIRVHSPEYNEQIMEFIEKHSDELLGSFQVDRLVLYQSSLSSEGVKYTKLFEVELGTSDTSISG